MLLKGASLLGKEAPPQKVAGDDRQCGQAQGGILGLPWAGPAAGL